MNPPNPQPALPPRESETPRTDAALIHNANLFDEGHGFSHLVTSYFARQLERELTAALAAKALAGKERDEAKGKLRDLLFSVENADETGYVTDIGFIDLEKLHEECHALLTPSVPLAPAESGKE